MEKTYYSIETPKLPNAGKIYHEDVEHALASAATIVQEGDGPVILDAEIMDDAEFKTLEEHDGY